MPRKITPHLSEALDQYLRVRSTRVAPITLRNDTDLLPRFVAAMGDPRVHLLEPAAVEGWFADLDVAGTTFNKYRTRVRGLLAFCSRRGWLVVDPLSEVRPRREQQTERLALSPAQMHQMLAGTELPRDRALLATALNTGLRAGDLVGLDVDALDLDELWLRVQIAKTGRFERLPVTADLAAELRAWLTYYAQELAGRDKALQPGSPLFPAMRSPRTYVHKGKHVMVAGWLVPERRISHPERIVHRALQRIGVDAPGAGAHTLRRSAARAMFELASEAGEDQALRVTAALLGHRSVRTTEIYLQHSHDQRKRDDLLRGRSLLAPVAEVVPIRAARI